MNVVNYTNKACSFTGYRTHKLNACLRNSGLTADVLEEVMRLQMLEMLDRGFKSFLSGMAIGADMMFARAALRLREQYPQLVRLVAAIPCLDHDKNWHENDRLHLQELVAQADEVVIVSKYPYFDGCMQKRNRYLVNNCDELLAVYDGQRGGTMQTINYAKGRGVKTTIIDPSRELIITLRESFETTSRIKLR
jgi:uncharacterized phage-like protein YoqJ